MFLHGQGLLAPSVPATTTNLHDLIEQLGFVQIDAINVLERAHHLILRSRMDDYRQPMLAHLLETTRELFEHWTHDASAIPVKWFPHWQARFKRDRTRIRNNRWWRDRLGPSPRKMLAGVLERVRQHGPTMSRDLERDGIASDSPRPADAWWNWKPRKAALEHLWRIGELSVVRRINFQKQYDLTERVLPEHCTLAVPTRREHVDWACRTAMERLGTASPAEIAGFWNAVPLEDARAWCVRALRSGHVVPIVVQSSDGTTPQKTFALPDWRSRLDALPPAPARMRLLCPFDPVLRNRKRTKRLFNFDYAFEAFTPSPKRRFGYYVMPIMLGDRLVGRIDPKLHRAQGLLEVKGLWWESGARRRAWRTTLEEELNRLAAFIGADRIEFSRNGARG